MANLSSEIQNSVQTTVLDPRFTLDLEDIEAALAFKSLRESKYAQEPQVQNAQSTPLPFSDDELVKQMNAYYEVGTKEYKLAEEYRQLLERRAKLSSTENSSQNESMILSSEDDHLVEQVVALHAALVHDKNVFLEQVKEVQPHEKLRLLACHKKIINKKMLFADVLQTANEIYNFAYGKVPLNLLKKILASDVTADELKNWLGGCAFEENEYFLGSNTFEKLLITIYTGIPCTVLIKCRTAFWTLGLEDFINLLKQENILATIVGGIEAFPNDPSLSNFSTAVIYATGYHIPLNSAIDIVRLSLQQSGLALRYMSTLIHSGISTEELANHVKDVKDKTWVNDLNDFLKFYENRFQGEPLRIIWGCIKHKLYPSLKLQQIADICNAQPTIRLEHIVKLKYKPFNLLLLSLPKLKLGFDVLDKFGIKNEDIKHQIEVHQYSPIDTHPVLKAVDAIFKKLPLDEAMHIFQNVLPNIEWYRLDAIQKSSVGGPEGIRFALDPKFSRQHFNVLERTMCSFNDIKHIYHTHLKVLEVKGVREADRNKDPDTVTLSQINQDWVTFAHCSALMEGARFDDIEPIHGKIVDVKELDEMKGMNIAQLMQRKQRRDALREEIQMSSLTEALKPSATLTFSAGASNTSQSVASSATPNIGSKII